MKTTGRGEGARNKQTVIHTVRTRSSYTTGGHNNMTNSRNRLTRYAESIGRHNRVAEGITGENRRQTQQEVSRRTQQEVSRRTQQEVSRRTQQEVSRRTKQVVCQDKVSTGRNKRTQQSAALSSVWALRQATAALPLHEADVVFFIAVVPDCFAACCNAWPSASVVCSFVT